MDTLINTHNFLYLLLRFVLHIGVTAVVCLIYYRKKQQLSYNPKTGNYVFTLMLISTIVFLVCYLLQNVHLEIAFAIGLFAIFGILRYRTSQIPIKEMTYMFVIIGLGVINALAVNTISIAELALTNIFIIVMSYGLERVLYRDLLVKSVLYEKIELVSPENRELLLQDLRKRTGYNVTHVQITRINFLRDTARLKMFYTPHPEEKIATRNIVSGNKKGEKNT